jgi:hypothetical protein
MRVANGEIRYRHSSAGTSWSLATDGNLQMKRLVASLFPITKLTIGRRYTDEALEGVRVDPIGRGGNRSGPSTRSGTIQWMPGSKSGRTDRH